MTIKVLDLMSNQVITAQPHHTLAQVKQKLVDHGIKTLPITNPHGEPVGMVSLSDISAAPKEGTPVSHIMTEKVYTIPQYESIEIAARMMRNHKIHHLVVTNEKAVVGIISSFDLLKLVENKRFEMKNPSTPKVRGVGKRHKAEINS